MPRSAATAMREGARLVLKGHVMVPGARAAADGCDHLVIVLYTAPFAAPPDLAVETSFGEGVGPAEGQATLREASQSGFTLHLRASPAHARAPLVVSWAASGQAAGVVAAPEAPFAPGP